MTTTTTKNIKPDYKQTPVGIIPEDWEVKNLGELCHEICGEYGANESAVLYSPDLPRYVRITDIGEDGRLIDDKVSANLTQKEVKKYKLEHEDLLFARTGATVGKTYLHIEKSSDMVYAGYLIRFRINSDLALPRIIKEYTNTEFYWNWVKAYSARSGQPGLNSAEYKSLNIPIPPLPEQEHIASCLTTWDKGIEKLSTLIAAKKQQKKGLMQGLFNGQVTVVNGQLIQAKEGEDFTEDWEEVRLGDISIKKSSSLQANSITENSGNYNVYGASGFLTKIDTYDEGQDYIAIVKDGSGVGNMYLLEEKSSVLGTLDKILPKDSNLYFLYSLLKRVNFIKYKVGGAIPHIYYKDYSKERVLVPSFDEQSAIAEVLSTADKEIDLLEHKIETMQSQKKGLMQVLLTGKKRLV